MNTDKKQSHPSNRSDWLTASIGIAISVLGVCALYTHIANVTIIAYPAYLYDLFFIILGLSIFVGTLVYGRIKRIWKEAKKMKEDINEEEEAEWQRKHGFKYAG